MGSATDISCQLPRSVGRSAFGANPLEYDAARSGYPRRVFELIAEHARCESILEIGPGTGLATRGLLYLKPQRLLAIEPDPSLFEFLCRHFVDDRLEIRRHGFGDIPIDELFDVVAVASAFHWLEPELALREMRRVLHKQGTLALWWNSYRHPNSGDAFSDAVAPLLEGVALAPSETAVGHYSLDEAFHRDQLRRCGFANIQFHRFVRDRVLDPMAARKLFASYSFVNALPGGERQRLLDAIEEIVEVDFGGRCSNRVVTALYLANPG